MCRCAFTCIVLYRCTCLCLCACGSLVCTCCGVVCLFLCLSRSLIQTTTPALFRCLLRFHPSIHPPISSSFYTVALFLFFESSLISLVVSVVLLFSGPRVSPARCFSAASRALLFAFKWVRVWLCRCVVLLFSFFCLIMACDNGTVKMGTKLSLYFSPVSVAGASPFSGGTVPVLLPEFA